jgi:pyruvate dehydrogenase E2 component (dihydrolipoamide acetyltransferase)
MTHPVLMPCFDLEQTPAVLRRWRVLVGQSVAEGQALAEIEAVKANLELEAFVGGVVRRLLVAEGATVRPFQPIAEIDDAWGQAGTAAERPRPGD